MGTVYVAQDRRLRRQVALKEARGDPRGPAALRLRREARIMAALDHPGIVPVFDMGTDPDGRPWYAMRVIRGRTLAVALEEAGGLAGRMRLLRACLAACEAVAYAHQRGIVHRDLKPDNVLVGPLGEIQVTDWGLARPMDDHGAGWDTVLSGVSTTSVGTVLGTPAYMSPEQAAGDLVDQRADVWSLGVCLFEVLAGRRPFAGDSAQAVLSQVLTVPVPDPSEVEPGVPAALGAIVRKATARDPASRYSDAGALAEDLEAWLVGRRVSAHRYSAADELGRALARSRRIVVAVGVVGILAVAVVGWFWRGSLVERDRALDATEALVEASARSDRHLAQALVAQSRAAANRGARGEAETLAAHALMLRESPEARGVLMDLAPRALLSSASTLPDDCLSMLLDVGGGSLVCRRADEVRLYDSGTMDLRWTAPVALGDVTFTLDGHVVGPGPRDAALRVLDGATGGARTLAVELARVADSPVSTRVASRLGFFNHASGELADVETGEIIQLQGASAGTLQFVHVLSSGDFLEIRDRALVEMRWSGGEIRRVPFDSDSKVALHYVVSADVSQDEDTVAMGFLDGWVEVRSRVDGHLLSAAQLVPGMINEVRLSPDGRGVAAVDERGGAWFWPVDSPESRLRLPGQADSVRFLGNRELLALGDQLRRWELPGSGPQSRLPTVHGVANIDWHGDVLAAALGDGRIRAWHAGKPQPANYSWFEEGVVKDVAVSPDGQRLAGSVLTQGMRIGTVLADEGAEDPSSMVHNCRRVVWLKPDVLVCNPTGPGPLVFSSAGESWPGLTRLGTVLIDAEPDATRENAVLVGSTGEVLLLRGGEEPEVRTLFTDPEVGAAALTPDGQWVVTAMPEEVQLRSAADGSVRWRQPTSTRLRDVTVSRDGRFVAGGERDGLARIWRASDGEPVAVLAGHEERVQAVVFSPDGASLATGSWDDSVRLWDLTVLDQSPSELLGTVESAWGLSLEDALDDGVGF